VNQVNSRLQGRKRLRGKVENKKMACSRWGRAIWADSTTRKQDSKDQVSNLSWEVLSGARKNTPPQEEAPWGKKRLVASHTRKKRTFGPKDKQQRQGCREKVTPREWAVERYRRPKTTLGGRSRS